MADDSPAWSSDGQWIAYHRVRPGIEGPPGVYVVSAAGGKPRLVLVSDWSGPYRLHFSPDGAHLVGIYGGQVIIIDVATGSYRFPVYAESYSGSADWSPDGRYIAYHHIYYTPATPDSSGIHVYDLETGTDRALHSGGTLVFGHYPIWSPDGTSIAFVGFTGTTNTIELYTLRDSSRRTLAESAESNIFDYPRWYACPANGTNGILFEAWEGGRHTEFVSLHGERNEWIYHLGPWDMPSPDGVKLTLARAQPTDSVGVLFVREVGDVFGIARRQLTFWHPLPS